jgi:hypothetical protein
MNASPVMMTRACGRCVGRAWVAAGSVRVPDRRAAVHRRDPGFGGVDARARHTCAAAPRHSTCGRDVINTGMAKNPVYRPQHEVNQLGNATGSVA